MAGEEGGEGETTPTAIRQAGPRTLEIVWADGHESRYDVRELRLACGCAQCVDEWSGEGRLDPASVPEKCTRCASSRGPLRHPLEERRSLTGDLPLQETAGAR